MPNEEMANSCNIKKKKCADSNPVRVSQNSDQNMFGYIYELIYQPTYTIALFQIYFIKIMSKCT